MNLKPLPFLLLALAACADDPPARIQWYATWKQAKEEAARLDRPLLLISAAPQCKGISGIW